MSYKAIDWAWDIETPTSASKLVLLALAKFASNDDKNECFPSIETLSKITKLDRRSVMKSLSILQSMEAIVIEKKFGSKNCYTLKTDYKNVTGESEKPVAKMSPVTKTLPVSNLHKTSSKFVQKPVAKMSPEYISNKSINNKKENTKEKSFDENFDDVPELFSETTYELSPAEVEEKPKTKRITKKSLIRPSDCSEQIFSDWVDFKRKVSKSVTQYMVNAIAREAQKAHITSEQAMVWQMEKGYQGFSADWYVNNSAVKQQKPSQQRRELTPDDFSDNQISFFASKLVRDQSFISEFGIGQTDYGIFASKVAANFRNPRFFPRYVTYLQKLGLIRH